MSDKSQYDVLDESYLGVPLGSTNVLILHSDDSIKLGSNHDELLRVTLGYVDGYRHRTDQVNEICSLGVYFDGYN